MTPTDGKSVSPPAKSDTDPTNVGDGSLIVRFSKDEGQNYGFDGIENGSGVWGRDNFNLGTTQYYVPIKSIEAGKDDYVNFNQQGSGGITFSLEINGTATPLTPEGNRIRLNVPITGNAALYAKDAQNRIVGKLTILSYPMVTKNVVLVSLNGSSLPEISALQSELNKVFAQGVARVSVSTTNLQTTAYDGAIDAERDHYKYSSEMRAIVAEFKEKNTIDNNTVYLFFGNTSTSDLAGVMNRGYQFGFIFQNDAKTIAHEIGHGLFNLEHTSNDNSYGLAANNLMDYSPTGKMLYKYQWQYVQSPPSVWGVFESGEDAEYATLPCLGIFDDCNDIIKNLRMMHNAAISNGAKGVLVKTTSMNKTLTGGNFEIDGIDISKIDLVFTGEPNVGYTLTMKEYEVTNTGFIIKSGDKNIVTIALSNSDLEGSPSTKDKLKSYLFATKEDTTKAITASFPITGEQLKAIFPGTAQERCDEVAALLNKYSDKFEINTPLRMAHFLAQTGFETSGYTANKSAENGCYKSSNSSWSGWIKNKKWSEPPIKEGCFNYDVSKYRQKKLPWNSIDDVPARYVCGNGNDSETATRNLFSYAYQCEGGNGDENSMDGFKYRGHGWIQLTWKKQYIAFDEWLKENTPENYQDVVANPDLIGTDRTIDALSGMWYWQKEKINKVSDDISKDSSLDQFKQVTLKINSAALHNAERKIIFDNAIKKIEK